MHSSEKQKQNGARGERAWWMFLTMEDVFWNTMTLGVRILSALLRQKYFCPSCRYLISKIFCRLWQFSLLTVWHWMLLCVLKRLSLYSLTVSCLPVYKNKRFIIQWINTVHRVFKRQAIVHIRCTRCFHVYIFSYSRNNMNFPIVGQ